GGGAEQRAREEGEQADNARARDRLDQAYGEQAAVEEREGRGEVVRVEDAAVVERAGREERAGGDLGGAPQVGRAVADGLVEERERGDLAQVEDARDQRHAHHGG